MAVIDVEQLLQPLSPDRPCGENLEDDVRFIAQDTAARGKPEMQYGDSIYPAEPPDWNEVLGLGSEMLKETKDLRVMCLMARGYLALRGIEAFSECLAVLRGYIDQYWEPVHPQLDPEDNNDPMIRVNTLSSLNDIATTVNSLRHATLAEGGVLGNFSLVDYEIAKGDLPPEPDTEPPTRANIDASFENAGEEKVKAKQAAVLSCKESIEAIESRVTELVGTHAATSFDNLLATFNKIKTIVDDQVRRLGFDEGEGGGGDESAEGEAEGAAAESAGAAPAAAAAAVPGEINSREDVIKTLDRICRYYDKHEPSSPIPLLLRRAQRLAQMGFLDIVKELTPEGLTQAMAISGVSDSSPPEEEY